MADAADCKPMSEAELAALPKGVWQPARVGRVRNYPRTAEAFAARLEHLATHREEARAEGRLTRKGVPNGWAGKKPLIEVLRRNAQTQAEMLIDDLDPPEDGETARGALLERVLAAGEVFEADEAALARVALTVVASIALDPTGRAKDRARAARIVLDFTKPLPSRARADEVMAAFEELVSNTAVPG